ncbi:MAG: DUF2270 domain-containing protein [Acidobacteriota bacterium]|nr:DUF2270 domain-containing protein [Acidobacteriota bacterium]
MTSRDESGSREPLPPGVMEPEEEAGGFPGIGLDGGDFNSAMIHLYRGEVTRSNLWRTRLDATTNWAVVTTGAALTFAFGASTHTPVVILIVTFLVLLFLFIEARRYRYFELWSLRVRLMETQYFSRLLSPPHRPDEGWSERLVESLRRPTFPISLLEALGRRYRRNYAPVFLVLALSWVVKILLHPEPTTKVPELLQRAAIGPLSGWAVLLIGIVFNAALIALGLFTVGLRDSSGEVFARTPRLFDRIRAATREALEVDLAALRPTLPGRRKQLAYIVSDHVQKIAGPLMESLDRGVTLLTGVGMYSGEEHGVLMVVVSGSQVADLKRIVTTHDPDAFVIITAAQDVRGEGWKPLEP